MYIIQWIRFSVLAASENEPRRPEGGAIYRLAIGAARHSCSAWRQNGAEKACLSVTAGPHTVPVEGCFMPKSIANPFLEMADCIANAVTKKVKYQRDRKSTRLNSSHAN